MGINVVLPPYLYHVSGLSLAASAGLSIIFTLTGTWSGNLALAVG